MDDMCLRLRYKWKNTLETLDCGILTMHPVYRVSLLVALETFQETKGNKLLGIDVDKLLWYI